MKTGKIVIHVTAKEFDMLDYFRILEQISQERAEKSKKGFFDRGRKYSANSSII